MTKNRHVRDRMIGLHVDAKTQLHEHSLQKLYEYAFDVLKNHATHSDVDLLVKKFQTLKKSERR